MLLASSKFHRFKLMSSQYEFVANVRVIDDGEMKNCRLCRKSASFVQSFESVCTYCHSSLLLCSSNIPESVWNFNKSSRLTSPLKFHIIKSYILHHTADLGKSNEAIWRCVLSCTPFLTIGMDKGHWFVFVSADIFLQEKSLLPAE